MPKTVTRLVLIGALLAGCASAPKTPAERAQLEQDAAMRLEAMLQKDVSLRPLLDRSAGYIVFPEVSEGGFIAGGAGARGVVYERGVPTGWAQLSRVSVGAQVGGQKYAELVAVRDPFTFSKIKSGNLNVGGQASATILRAGAAAATNFGENGVAVVIDPIGGAMVNVSVSGQRIRATTRM
jgi:lipid-binding SYLF domain-containing protein